MNKEEVEKIFDSIRSRLQNFIVMVAYQRLGWAGTGKLKRFLKENYGVCFTFQMGVYELSDALNKLESI